jgi:hypothetical protein
VEEAIQDRLGDVKLSIRSFLMEQLASQQLSQLDLALLSGQSHTTVGRMLKVGRNARLSSLVTLAHVLGYKMKITFEPEDTNAV